MSQHTQLNSKKQGAGQGFWHVKLSPGLPAMTTTDAMVTRKKSRPLSNLNIFSGPGKTNFPMLYQSIKNILLLILHAHTKKTFFSRIMPEK